MDFKVLPNFQQMYGKSEKSVFSNGMEKHWGNL